MPRGQGQKRSPSYLPTPLDILVRSGEIRERNFERDRLAAARRKPKPWTPPIVHDYDSDMARDSETFYRGDTE